MKIYNYKIVKNQASNTSKIQKPNIIIPLINLVYCFTTSTYQHIPPFFDASIYCFSTVTTAQAFYPHSSHLLRLIKLPIEIKKPEQNLQFNCKLLLWLNTHSVSTSKYFIYVIFHCTNSLSPSNSSYISSYVI